MTHLPVARRRALAASLGTLLLGAAGFARSQSWPNKPVHLVLGAPAGTAPDIAARFVGERFATLWRQPVVIENRPGAGGMLAMEYVKAAAPDGHTLMFAHSGAISVTPSYIKSAKYDPVQDFTALGTVVDSPMMIVARPDAAALTLPDLLAAAKARPGAIAIGSTEQATYPYLIGRSIAERTGATFLHVTFNQPGQALQALSSGDVQYTIDGLAALMPQVKAGRVKAIAVTGDRVVPGTEEIPLVKDAVPNFVVMGWFALIGPKRMPEHIAGKINNDLNQVLATQEVAIRLRDLYLYPSPRSQAETVKFFQSEIDRWGAMIRRVGITAG